MGTYHRAKLAKIVSGTIPLYVSLITEDSGKAIKVRIKPANVRPKPLTALSAKLLAENKTPSSLRPVSS